MDKCPENSYRFYRNTACKYFPCHRVKDDRQFNCLFCYCPLYFLGEKCGGHFKLTGRDKEIKDCSGCLIPHVPENYELILEKISENIRQM